MAVVQVAVDIQQNSTVDKNYTNADMQRYKRHRFDGKEPELAVLLQLLYYGIQARLKR